MKDNVIDFNKGVKKHLAKMYSSEYKSLSEKYILMIIDEIEQKGYNIRDNEDMLDEFMFLKDVLNLVAQSCSSEISETDKKVLDNIIDFMRKEELNDTM